MQFGFALPHVGTEANKETIVAVAQRALKEGVAVRPVSSMYQAGDGPPGLILGLSAFSREQMTEAASKLARIIPELAEPSKTNQF